MRPSSAVVAPGMSIGTLGVNGNLTFDAGSTLEIEVSPTDADRINVSGLPPVPGQNVACQIVKPDGTTIDFEAVHTFSPEQVEWFKAGSALNIVREKVAAAGYRACAATDTGSASPVTSWCRGT